jgi:di/tripeptidase
VGFARKLIDIFLEIDYIQWTTKHRKEFYEFTSRRGPKGRR